MNESLTAQEQAAMNVIWKIGETNVKAVLNELASPKPPYTTLASTIKNLEKKGYLQSRQIGNMYLYKPAVGEVSYKKASLRNMVKQHFDNSYKNLVAFFAEQKNISAKELKEIVDMIENKKK